MEVPSTIGGSGVEYYQKGITDLIQQYNFTFYAAGLDADTVTDVDIKSMTQINGNRDISTKVLSDRELLTTESWSGMSNAQGDFNLVGFMDNTTKQIWGPYCGEPGKPPANPVTDYSRVDLIFPQDDFPDGDFWVEKTKASSSNGQTTIVDDGVPTNAMCAIYESVLLFELKQGGIVKNTTEITLIMNVCTNLDVDAADTPFSITLDLDVFLDGINKTISPSNLNSSVEKAVIPYNKTTEREVVHLDYRIKSTD